MGTLQGKKVSEKSDVSGSKNTKKTPEAVGHGSSPLWQKLAFGEGATTNNSSTGLHLLDFRTLLSLSAEKTCLI